MIRLRAVETLRIPLGCSWSMVYPICYIHELPEMQKVRIYWLQPFRRLRFSTSTFDARKSALGNVQIVSNGGEQMAIASCSNRTGLPPYMPLNA